MEMLPDILSFKVHVAAYLWFYSDSSAFQQVIGFRSRFSQCVDYMRFNEKSFCFRWQETTKLMLFCNTKTSSLVILCDLRYLTGNISSVVTKHMSVQRKLHRFAYLIVQIIFMLLFISFSCYSVALFSSLSPAPEINTGNFAPAETTSEAYGFVGLSDTCVTPSPAVKPPALERFTG